MISLFFNFFMQEKSKNYSYNHQIALGGTIMIPSYGSNIPIPDDSPQKYHLYKYMPIVFEITSTFPLIKKAKKNQLSWYVNPSMAMVILKDIDYGIPSLVTASWNGQQPYNSLKNDRLHWEGGFHTGLLHQILILENFMFFYGLGSGPFYFSTATYYHEQNGYIFDSHFLFGFKSKLKFFSGAENLELSFLARYRHLSNAGIYKNNMGLDNVMVGVGFAYLFKPSKKSQQTLEKYQ